MRGTAADPWDQRHLQAEATQGPVASRDKGESIRYITAALYVLVCARMKGGICAPSSTQRKRLTRSPPAFLHSDLSADEWSHLRSDCVTLRIN